ncbi:alpha/beta hydrolase [Actinoplanes subtropicus]|uniref:alpha/beta hydrolase n=1 Tax=Actinoplanes subtropicus TaxID=543632 RepID=UPI0007C4F064|nr:alpha/beta hydrolase-fold protein [Actinoplanes subtropicus]
MGPDSLAVELIALAASVLAAVALSLFWSAMRRWLRGVVIVACLLTVTATTLVWVNRQVDSYPTWASLFGSTADAGGVGTTSQTKTVSATSAGKIVRYTVAGKASGITVPMWAYLPPGYAESPNTRYPVIVALHGYPSSPVQWLKGFGVADVLNGEIAAGRMAPTVVLFPYQTPKPTIDTECANLLNGPQAETFLTVDVPDFVRTHMAVRTDPAAWGLIGYSAGGYCAANLALRHPNQFAAGASLSGYSSPGIVIGNGLEHTEYDDVWRLKHLPIPAVALYLSCAKTDKMAMRATQELAKAAHAPLSITLAYIAGGGHNAGTWHAMEAPAFDWLSNTLGRPTTMVASPGASTNPPPKGTLLAGSTPPTGIAPSGTPSSGTPFGGTPFSGTPFSGTPHS